MKKKITSILLALVTTTMLAACGSGNAESKADNSVGNTAAESTEKTESTDGDVAAIKAKGKLIVGR